MEKMIVLLDKDPSGLNCSPCLKRYIYWDMASTWYTWYIKFWGAFKIAVQDQNGHHQLVAPTWRKWMTPLTPSPTITATATCSRFAWIFFRNMFRIMLIMLSILIDNAKKKSNKKPWVGLNLKEENMEVEEEYYSCLLNYVRCGNTEVVPEPLMCNGSSQITRTWQTTHVCDVNRLLISLDSDWGGTLGHWDSQVHLSNIHSLLSISKVSS